MNQYHAAKFRIYDMGLLFHFRRHSPAQSRNLAPAGMDANLLSCAQAIKQYLDSFLLIDPSRYSLIPFEEWSRLVIAFFILYKLSAGSRDVPDWNTQLCRNTIDLETSLTTVARRLRGTRSFLESSQPQRDELYFVLPLILETARDSYVLARDAPDLVGPGHRVHTDLTRSSRAEGTASSASILKCPATGFWIDKALAVDHGTDWHGVSLPTSVHPAEQLAKHADLWHALLDEDVDMDASERTTTNGSS